MSALRSKIEEFADDLTQDEDFAAAYTSGAQVAAVLRDILKGTPDDALFDDGLAHALPNTALCGAPAHYPARAFTPDCPRCEALLMRMAP